MEITPIIYEFAVKFITDLTPGRPLLVPYLPRSEAHNYLQSDLHRVLTHRIEQTNHHLKYQFWFGNKAKSLDNFKMLANLATFNYCEEHNFKPDTSNRYFCEEHLTECLADFCVEIGIYTIAAAHENVQKAPLHAAMCIAYALEFFKQENRITSESWQEFLRWGERRKQILDSLNPRLVDWSNNVYTFYPGENDEETALD